MGRRPRATTEEETRFVARLKKISDKTKISLPVAARMSGIPIGTIYNWNRHRGSPTLAHAKRLAEVFGCDVSEFDKDPDASVDVLADRIRPFGLTINEKATGVDERLELGVVALVAEANLAHERRHISTALRKLVDEIISLHGRTHRKPTAVKPVDGRPTKRPH